MLFLISNTNYLKMISINNGKVFIDGEHSTNPELIGYALLDFAETVENNGYAIDLKDEDDFINSVRTCINRPEKANQ